MAGKGKVVGAGAAAALTLATPMIAHFEGMIPHTYADPVGIPTICYGHTGADVTPGRTETAESCMALLRRDEARELDEVLDCVHIDLQPNEAAALVSFTHSVGKTKLCTSTLARLANAGATPEAWCPQMRRWTYAPLLGVKIEWPGLVSRRDVETKVCLGKSPA